MAAYGSPLPLNSHSRYRAFNDSPTSPNSRTSWGAAAGRLKYSSPITIGNRWADSAAVASRSSSKTTCTDDSVSSPNCFTPRRIYGSPAGSPIPRRGANFSSDRSRCLSTFSDYPDAGVHVASISRIVQDDSPNSSTSLRGSEIVHGRRIQARTTLPAWTLDPNGDIKLTLPEILHYNQIRLFARDKMGCQFLQNNFPEENTPERQLLSQQILEDEETFQCLCSDVFGNFFVQRLIECSTVSEMRWVSARLLNRMNALCLNRYSCRVVQKAIEILPLDLKGVLLVELHQVDLVRLCTDQNANHVIQKIMNSLPLSNWSFLVDYMTDRKENLFAVAEDKYGCRIIQLAIETLSTTKKSANADALLTTVMDIISSNCDRLASNEYANYIIQHVISAGCLSFYRDVIIQECILGNILSMSQEKYASHVVEKSLEFAPPPLLHEMMEEIFDGYVPHPETKKDALDIMLFHQYGNYVIQRMLSTCIEAARAFNAGIELTDMEQRLGWLRCLRNRVLQNESKLCRYSSGKKILDMLAACPPIPIVSPLTNFAKDLSTALPSRPVSPGFHA